MTPHVLLALLCSQQLFREWDEDGDGHVDKKEFRKAVSALGYDVPNKDIDAVFATLDVSGDGAVDYNEMKKALTAMIQEKSKKYAEKRMQEQKEAKQKAKEAKKLAALEKAKSMPSVPVPEIPPEEVAGELVVNAFSRHTHTVVMLHSFKSKAEMYARLYRRFDPRGWLQVRLPACTGAHHHAARRRVDGDWMVRSDEAV